MANLTIDIVTKYDQSLQGAAKVTEGYKRLGKQLIETSNEGKVADDVQKKYIASLNAALLGLEKEHDALASSKAQIKLLTQERGKMSAALGTNAELTKKLSAAIKEESKNLQTLEGSSKKASKNGMAELEKSSGNAATKLLSVAKNILKFQLLMGPITSAVRGFRNTISDSIKVAAEAEQTYNKLSTVFDGLADSALRAAQAISGQLGVATSTAADALSTVGDLLQAQGMGTAASLGTASEWVKQFQDIIAFKDLNISLEEFAQNFMSGAAGNLRNFRTFGSIVKESAVNARLAAEGLDKLTGSQLELAKMTTRASIALEQQKNAMGATEREWNTMLSVNRRLSEAWKEYKENLGSTLNEFLKPAKSWLTEILDYTNDVTRALKEIDGGEFTVKVKQETSDEFIDRISGVMQGVASSNPATGETGNWFTSWLNSMIPAMLAQGGASTKMQMEAAESNANAKIFTAKQVRDIILATGATDSQIMEAAERGGYTVTEDVLLSARELVGAYLLQQQAIENTKKSLLENAEAYDSFTEALASLGHLNMEGTDYVGALSMLDGEFLEEASADWANNVALKIRQAINQVGGLGPGSFMDGIDLAFGVGDKEKAYQSWLEEIRSLYTVLYNREVEYGDVGQNTLDKVIALWGKVNSELQEYQARIQSINKATSDYNALVTNYSGIAAGYRTDIANIGLSSDQITRNSLLAAFEEANSKRSPAARVIKEALDAFDDLMKAQDRYNKKLELEAYIKSQRDARAATEIPTEYQTQLARFGMSDRDILVQQRNELASKHDPLWVAIQREIDAFDELEKKTRELAIAEAWAATGDRALGATGTLGGVIQSFQGEGDIWSKLVNALLTILENTESWPKMAETLDSIFNMFEPVAEALLDLIMSLPWQDIIFMLKVVASAITVISAIVQGIQTVIKWLWENIKTALRNVATDVYNLFHPFNQRSRDQYTSFEELGNMLAKIYDNTTVYLERIWNANEDIVKNTDKDNLAVLRDLYARKIINEDQFYAGARVLQKDMIFDPVSADSTKYVSKGAGASSSVSYGGVTIQFNGSNSEEMKRWITDFFNQNGIGYNVAIGG